MQGLLDLFNHAVEGSQVIHRWFWSSSRPLSMEGWRDVEPPLDMLMWPSSYSQVVEKKVPWVKLVGIIDLLKEKISPIVLNKLMSQTFYNLVTHIYKQLFILKWLHV